MTTGSFSSENKPKIIIIGAGLSGLAAAYRLQQMGHNIQVYEARHRPGGRVLSVKIGESYEELGGENFLDGNEGRYSLKLIKELNLETHHFEKPFSCIYANSKQSASYSEIIDKFKIPPDLWKVMEEAASCSTSLQEVIDSIFKESPELLSIFTRALTTYEGSDVEKLAPSCIDSLYEIFLLFQDLSVRSNGKPEGVKRLCLKGGNAELPLALCKKLEHKIQYGSVLTAVRKEQQKIILTFNTSQEISADIILLTIPCSLYQDIEFASNTIPQEQLLEIKNVQYGTNSKILFPVTLKNKKCEFMILPHFVSWLNEDDSIMTFYMGGKQGILDLKRATSLFDQEIPFLVKEEGGIQINVNTMEEGKDMQLASYGGAVFKSWMKDPYAKGSYSNRGIGKSAMLNQIITVRGEVVRNVFRPVRDQIFFAGEHTTTLPVLGTLESAIESGERMARLIEKSLKGS
ncbi:NAD(P)/FAD-dependent oxidoreductase [Kamptonema cortianum]|nr:NAD(P)/FAD-dependent oxidoreductase [Geitlerinema splendidum]MDK3159544.1 NAD(P)/FAD-dependent oxidoreductase [Kamptonema cortianum]